MLRAQRGQLRPDRCELRTYGANQEETKRFNLPCGGTMRLLVEPIKNAQWVGQVLQKIHSQLRVKRTLHLKSLHIDLKDASLTDSFSCDEDTLEAVYGPRLRLLLIGAGQTSAYLARMAQALDYQVSVCDPRVEMRQTWSVADTELLSCMPDEAVQAHQAETNSAIVTLTHDPKLDDMARLEALKSNAFYVGALGSRYNNDKRRLRLALFDLTAAEIDRLHGPVGMDIGSRTPAEIAVAILAQMISIRNQLLPLRSLPDQSIVHNPLNRSAVHDFA
jgi:xanthine dehydrogenase accessory factor